MLVFALHVPKLLDCGGVVRADLDWEKLAGFRVFRNYGDSALIPNYRITVTVH